jgi:hypothetical protein
MNVLIFMYINKRRIIKKGNREISQKLTFTGSHTYHTIHKSYRKLPA